MEHLINIVSQDVAAIPQSTKLELSVLELSGLYLSYRYSPFVDLCRNAHLSVQVEVGNNLT